MSLNISKDDVNDVGEFYGIPDYHDFRIIYNDPVFSISVYRALSVANNTPVTIKLVNVHNEEDNLALEEEYRILTAMKQSLPAHHALKGSKSFNSGIASYFKKNPRHSVSAETDQAFQKPENRPFPTIIEKRRVYGMQCNMLIYDYLSSTTLTRYLPRNSFTHPKNIIITGAMEEDSGEDSTYSFHPRPIPNMLSLEVFDQGRLSEEYLNKQKSGLRTSETRPASECRPLVEVQASIAAAEKNLSVISINSNKQLHKFKSLKIDQKLYIFFQIADALDIMHRLNICYLDISPENIFVKFVNNLNLPAAQLSKFDFAARSKTSGLNLNKRYMSPEQTERTSYLIDYRTDLYSLGIIMWEYFTGEHPYKNIDQTEMVYAHLAMEIPDPRTINPQIPTQLAEIIKKLVQNNPDNRYQLASALKNDIHDILEKINEARISDTNTMVSYDQQLLEAFKDWNWKPGALDFSPKLKFKREFYGREEELDRIFTAYGAWIKQRNSDHGPKLLILSGDKGIGESNAGIGAVIVQLSAKMGTVSITAANERLDADVIPNRAFRSVLNQIVTFLLSEPDSSLKEWEDKIIEELGIEQLVDLYNYIPSISKAITKIDLKNKQHLKTPVEKLEIHKCVSLFLQIFSSQTPLVIILGDLDDDRENYDILKECLSNGLGKSCFFVIYTSDPKSIPHYEYFEKFDANIEIPPLTNLEVVSILEEVITPRSAEVHSLANLFWRKSAGNQLFLKKLVLHCEQSGFFSFNQSKMIWTWKMQRIENLVNNTADVLSIMKKQIDSLEPNTKHYLQLASCIGVEFTTKLLSIIISDSHLTINAILTQAAILGLISYDSHKNRQISSSNSSLDLSFRLASKNVSGMPSNTSLVSVQYCDFVRSYYFQNRTIVEYLQSQVNEKEREIIYFKLIRALSKISGDDSFASSLKLLGYYEHCKNLLTDDEDWLCYTELHYNVAMNIGSNLKCIKLLESGFATSKNILDTNVKKKKIVYDIGVVLGRLYMRKNLLAETEAVLMEMKPETDIQHSEWLSMKVELHVARNQMLEAMSLASNSNCQMSFFFKDPKFFNPHEALASIEQILSGSTVESIMAMQSPNLVFLKLADTMIQNCHFFCKGRDDFVNAALFSIMGARLTLSNGIIGSDNGGFYFAELVHLYLGATFDYFDLSCAKMLHELSILCMQGKTQEQKLHIFKSQLGGSTIFWSYNEVEKIANSVCDLSLNNSDLSFQCLSKFQQMCFFSCGKTLGMIRDFDRRCSGNRRGPSESFQFSELAYRAYENFASGTPIANYYSTDTTHGKFLYYSQLLQAMIYSYPSRIDLCSSYEEVLGNFRSTWLYVDAVLCGVILNCENYGTSSPSMSRSEKGELIASIDHGIQIIELYANAQDSGEHRFKAILANAEKDRALGNIKSGIEKYEEAIEGAHNSGNILFCAWINELYANFWIKCNSKRLSKSFLINSMNMWEQWGADGKIDDLNFRFPDVFKKKNSIKRFSVSGKRTSRIGSDASSTLLEDVAQAELGKMTRKNVDVDINTFLKVTNSITNEKDLDVLVDKILGNLMYNTGATKAVILFNNKGTLELQRIITVNGIEEFNNTENHTHVPMALINYTFRTQEAQVFTDYPKDAVFATDFYMEKYLPKSILSCPIKHQNTMTGAIYLENTLQAGIFTLARVNLVKSIMASASIAIANAHLLRKNIELSQALQESGKRKEPPIHNLVETPMEKIFDSIKTIKDRFNPDDPIVKTLDLVLSTMISDGLFSANLVDANDQDGIGIDQDTKIWIESSLLMTNKSNRTGDAPRSSTTIMSPHMTRSGLSHLPVLGEIMSATLQSPSTNGPPKNFYHFEKTNELINRELALSSDSSFDCFKLHDLTSGRPLAHLSTHILKKSRVHETFRLNQKVVDLFFQKIESSYNNLPYHNSIHATDVLHTVELMLLNCPDLMRHFSPLETFSVCIASAIHDLDHPGINNNFLVQLNHPLAILYNDSAILESHHSAKAFEIASKTKYNIFETMTPDQYRQSRKMIISIVLATDLAQHFQFISKFKGKVSSSSLNLEDEADRHLIMQMAVKCGDLGNPAKDFEKAKKWTNLVMEEFFRQGDHEKKLGLPVSKFMDRNDTNVSKCQIGFIDFLVTPLFEAWTSFSKSEYTELCQQNIVNNRTQWQLQTDNPNILPGVASTEFESLDSLLDIAFPSFYFGHSNEQKRAKSEVGSNCSKSRKFSFGKGKHEKDEVLLSPFVGSPLQIITGAL